MLKFKMMARQWSDGEIWFHERKFSSSDPLRLCVIIGSAQISSLDQLALYTLQQVHLNSKTESRTINWCWRSSVMWVSRREMPGQHNTTQPVAMEIRLRCGYCYCCCGWFARGEPVPTSLCEWMLRIAARWSALQVGSLTQPRWLDFHIVVGWFVW